MRIVLKALTTFGAECYLSLAFWPKLPHPAARFVYDSSPRLLVKFGVLKRVKSEMWLIDLAGGG